MDRAIPSFDLSQQHRVLNSKIDAAIKRVFTTGNFILGEEVAMFEKEVAAFIGTRHAIACACGTDALQLALCAAGVGNGDEVITSAFSFVATAEAILHAGATPVLVDIDPATFTLDPAAVEAALSAKTRGIMPVHLYGHPAEMNTLQAIAERHDLVLIEDCAQAFGARYGNRYAGALALAGCHSFFPTKNLGGCGDGGLVTTNDEELAQRMRMLRNHGRDNAEGHRIIGYNSRLNEIQAAVLRVKLRSLKDFNQRRRRLASVYTAALQGSLQTPTETAECEHAFNQYTVLCERRDAIKTALDKAKIGSRIYYPRTLPEQTSLQNLFRGTEYDQALRVSRQCLSLPMFPELPVEDAEYIADTIVGALQ